ncbi:hypothetical protein FDP41_008050 [Naegleria fowleri]|uniref:Uncharacterized protein n=1 Tax=Naegleria fowleri TaxID=5763 RepID=A0A6A5CFU6_NAEFO|nr:uncharacterized protein FDP41_008050 [Naegleria fowleri]KAF0984135.1 hypothetical protein FDP41_008050 [Naegleria fowleri]CAG4710418.1 unnamed protein product [Naegleria fowleri]
MPTLKKQNRSSLSALNHHATIKQPQAQTTSSAPLMTSDEEQPQGHSTSHRVDEKPTINGVASTTPHPLGNSATLNGSSSLRIANMVGATTTHQAIASPRGSLKVFSSWVNHQMRSTQWINDLARNFNLLVNPNHHHRDDDSNEHDDNDEHSLLRPQQTQTDHDHPQQQLHKGFSNSFMHMLRPQNQQIYYSPDNHQNVDSNHLEDQFANGNISSAQENDEEPPFVPSEGEEDEESSINNTISNVKIERKGLLGKHHHHALPSGITLDHDENVMHIEKPAPSFRKNVLILFVFGALVTSLICYLPLNFLSEWMEENENMTLTFTLLLNFLYFAIIACYLFILFYVLMYKLVYCKLLLTYVVTDKRLFICRGYYPLENLFQKLSSRMSWSILEREEPIMFWSMKDEIEHLYFTLDINDHTASNMSKADKDCVGSIYFGYSIDRVFLPFSVVTEIIHAGFVSIPNVYSMLDRIILQCNKLGNYSVQRARLLNASDSELNPRVFEKKYALCGLPLMFCFKQSHSGRKLGKITKEELNMVNYV